MNTKYDNSKKIIIQTIKKKCYKCGKSFYDKSTLNTHLSNVHEANPYKKCDLCGAYFKYLNKHKNRCSLKRYVQDNNYNNKEEFEKIYNRYKKIRLTKNIFYFPELYIGHGGNNFVYYGQYFPQKIDLAIKFDDKKDYTIIENFITKHLKDNIGFPISYGYFKYKKNIFLHKLY